MLKSASDFTISLDPKMVRQWKAGYDSHNEFVLQERRIATYQERMLSLTATWSQENLLGFKSSDEVDLTVNDIWQKLKLAYFNRLASDATDKVDTT